MTSRVFFFTGVDVLQLQPFKVVCETCCLTRNRRCFRSWSKLSERRKDEPDDFSQTKPLFIILVIFYIIKKLSDNCISVKYVQIPKNVNSCQKISFPKVVMRYPLMTSHRYTVILLFLSHLTTYS